MKKYITLVVHITVVFIVYFSLSEVVNDLVMLAILVAITIVYFMFTNNKGKTNTHYLDSQCNVDKYLEYVETNIKEKGESQYLVYKSYGDLLNNNILSLEDDINKIDISTLDLNERFLLEEIKIKLLYNNKDIEGYTAKLIEITNGEFSSAFEKDLLTLKAVLYLLKEEYEELIDLLFEIIPKQFKSYRVIELEYYLALAYIELGKEEDAIAVLEFITKRDLKIDYVVKSRALLQNMHQN